VHSDSDINKEFFFFSACDHKVSHVNQLLSQQFDAFQRRRDLIEALVNGRDIKHWIFKNCLQKLFGKLANRITESNLSEWANNNNNDDKQATYYLRSQLWRILAGMRNRSLAWQSLQKYFPVYSQYRTEENIPPRMEVKHSAHSSF
jgi:hypothetical protein